MEDWQRLESHVLMLVDGTAPSGSGRFNTKGDVRTKELYIECKYRANKRKSTQIDLSWTKTAENHTRGTGLIPIIAFQTSTAFGNTRVYYYCRKADSHLFVVDADADYTCPDNWVAITEDSVKGFAEQNE